MVMETYTQMEKGREWRWGWGWRDCGNLDGEGDGDGDGDGFQLDRSPPLVLNTICTCDSSSTAQLAPVIWTTMPWNLGSFRWFWII